MSVVELKNVTKIFMNHDEEVTAVKDMNLSIDKDEFIVLVGPSGCGKTTTLRMVAGLEEVTEGEIFIDGELVNNLMPKERKLAMVFQSYALYPYMTVYDNMAFGLKLMKMSGFDIKKRIQEASKMLEIEYLLNRLPKALSGGQKQRVAIGRAITKNPKVFLMDEPLSNLDAKLRTQMRVEIVKLYRRLNIPVIYVTHDQVEAMTMATRIVVMDKGIVQQVDKPHVIYNRPANTFVAGFFGTPSMNFVKAVLFSENDDVYFRITEVGIGRTRNIVKRVEWERDLKVPEHRKKEILNSEYIGKEVIIGIRPEHIYLDSELMEKFKDSVMEAKVDTVEPIGMEKLLYVKVGENITLTAKIKNDFSCKRGERVRLALNINMIYVFDKSNGKTIFYGYEPD